MELSCVKRKIENTLQSCSGLLMKNSDLKVLSCFLLEASGNNLHIRATNIDTAVLATIPAKVTMEGSVAVPGDILLKLIASMGSDEQVTMKLEKDNLDVLSENTHSLIKSIDKSDFPSMPDLGGETVETEISIRTLREGIDAVSFCASRSNVKPELSSVFVKKDIEALAFAATDGYRLAEKKYTVSDNEEFSLLLPVNSISNIMRVLGNVSDDAQISMNFSDNQISFITDDLFITTRLTLGNFPDYGQLIPTEKETSVVMLKQDLSDVLKRIGIFSDDFNEVMIVVDTKNKFFELSAANQNVGQNTSKLAGAIEGESVDMKFNHQYIADCIPSVTTDSVELSFTGPGKPMKITTVPKTGFTYIVMALNK